MKKLIYLFVLVMLVSGCATTPKQASFQPAILYENIFAPSDTVFGTIKEVIPRHNLKISEEDISQKFIKAEYVYNPLQKANQIFGSLIMGMKDISWYEFRIEEDGSNSQLIIKGFLAIKSPAGLEPIPIKDGDPMHKTMVKLLAEIKNKAEK